jgi:hypothetical protein
MKTKPNSPPPKPSEPSPDTPRMPAIFQVVVQCRDERDQEEIYRRMKAEGRKCRVLTL